MINPISVLSLTALVVVTGQLVPCDARAQNIRLGSDNESVFRILESGGYTNPVITKRGLTIIRTEACKGSVKYRVKVSILGRIKSAAKIGACPVAQGRGYPREAAVALLQQQGYTQIEAVQRGPNVDVLACLRGQKYQFIFNHRGKLKNQQVVGRCRPPGLGEKQIAAELSRQGYKRVVITDNKLPRYVAEACKGRDRLRIEMNRRGIIRSERKIGECGRQINRRKIATLLEKAGFENIEIVDNRRPPYIARACKGADKLEVSVGRYGRIFDKKQIGTCRSPVDPANLSAVLGKNGFDRIRPLRTNRAPYLVEACKGQTLFELAVGNFGKIQRQDRVGRCSDTVSKQTVMSSLSERGYFNIKLRRAGDGWNVDACRDNVKYAVNVDFYGDFTGERKIGQCRSQTVLEVLRNLENRGATATSMIVEGCYAGKKYRWAFDRLGDRTGRTAIGRC